MKNSIVKLKIQIYNLFLLNGNKNICEKLFLKTIKVIQKLSKKNSIDLIKLAVINNSYSIEIKKLKRKRKKIKEFPYIPNKKTRIFLALKNILSISKNKHDNFHNKLKQQILESSKNAGVSIKKKEAVQEQSLKLKKYAHYRWLI